MDDPTLLPQFLTEGWRTQSYEPFRSGVSICVLRQDDPKVALLRYEPGASVPYHRHPGLEVIQVLDGSQSDDRHTYGVGDVVLNPPGSAHRVWSTTGCVVLILWERPVEFVPEPESG